MNQRTTAVAERNPAAINLPVATAISGTDITAGQGRAAFLPTSMGEAMEIAKLMAAGNFVPKHLRGVPGDCLAVVMQAARWGMDPFAVGNKTYFVNDRMAYEAQLVNAVVNSSNVLDGRLKVEWSGQGNELKCFVSGRIKGDTDIKTREVKLATIKTRNSPLWQSDPEQQIAYFATRAWARLHAPEVLLGVYTPDEIESIPGNRVDGYAPKRLSSDMLAQQAGVMVEQTQIARDDHSADAGNMVEDAEIEEVACQQDEAKPISDRMLDGVADRQAAEAQETLDAIDGPLDNDLTDPDPREAKADEIIAALDKCATVIDLNAHWARSETDVIAMPYEIAARIRAAFKAKGTALKAPAQ